eukprot:CAMPEP_0206140782 /NCGR_PEP_ID=MMETSP1473-20131121/10629_1 /ASSEMBLY_ACC=CAM_ASM_001109 /TAXON_ID=1461547 /ORGANISM="Stichococcus sp, Strain RCC1054" /LENGTH=34 /DNA_ID= /DNA_START= /DNA_END= /DNA_ORIENTATION=
MAPAAAVASDVQPGYVCAGTIPKAQSLRVCQHHA